MWENGKILPTKPTMRIPLRKTEQTQQRPQPITTNLTTETVDGASLAFECIDNIERGDRLPLGVLGVGDSIANDAFKENFEDTSGFLIDEARDTLDTTTAGETADCRLRDALYAMSEINLSQDIRMLSRRILR